MAVSNHALSSAILQALETGAYPDTDDVASAKVEPAATPSILDALQETRSKVQVAFGLHKPFESAR